MKEEARAVSKGQTLQGLLRHGDSWDLNWEPLKDFKVEICTLERQLWPQYGDIA